jgi:hypothetical protein
MNKQKLIPILSAVLVLQLVLAAGLHWAGSANSAGESGQKLLAVDFDQLDGLRIEDGNSSVAIRKINQEWQLPDIDFPAAATRLNDFLDKLNELEKGWPVATSGDAAGRFKVSDDEFERRITLSQGEDVKAVLYLGTSPRYRNVHARLDGESEIHLIELGTYEAGIRQDDWIDKEILKQDPADITRVSWGDWVFEKKDDVWTLPGLKEDEQANVQEIQTLVDKIANIRIEGVLGKENKKEFGLDKPQHTLALGLTDGKSINYQLSKPDNESYFVLKSSALQHYLQLPTYTINPILDTKRDKLVQVRTEDATTDQQPPSDTLASESTQ